MKSFRTRFSSTVEINFNLLMGLGCGLVAWAIWPQTAEWWGLGVISGILWLGAFGSVARACRVIGKNYAREQAIADFMAQGPAPKSARMASLDDLKRAGMVE